MKIDYANSASILRTATQYRDNSIVLRQIIYVLVEDNQKLRDDLGRAMQRAERLAADLKNATMPSHGWHGLTPLDTIDEPVVGSPEETSRFRACEPQTKDK